MHALRMLDLERHAQIALYKVAMTWPLETSGLREFARGKRALLVVEEKRSFVWRWHAKLPLMVLQGSTWMRTPYRQPRPERSAQ